MVLIVSKSMVREAHNRYEKPRFSSRKWKHNLFVKRREPQTTILLVYVDNMIMTSDDKEKIAKIKGVIPNALR